MPNDVTNTEPDWGAFRGQMPITQRWAYLDHAAVAPLSAPALEAIVGWAEEATFQGDPGWPKWSRQVEHVRQVAADLIGADPAEVALVKNTTAGISLVAEGLDWQPGENVVTLANEFPSNLYPWMNLESRGVETRRVAVRDCRVDLQQLADACDEQTRVVAVSWVGFADGWRNNIDELVAMVHDHGALLFLDAIQGLGVFPLDLKHSDIDFLAADGHKWMLGPEGAGIFYVRREHLERLRPWGVGWHSVVHDFDHIALDFKPSAARFEGGSENMAGFIGLGASLELLSGLGVENVARRILAVTDMACEKLTAAGATIASVREGDHRSGIVSFAWPGDMAQMRTKLAGQNVALSYRGGRLRISPHAYNDEQDIDRLVEALQNPG